MKKILVFVAVALVLCIVAMGFLQTQAVDCWGYGKLGVNDGTAQSAVFYFEVRGVAQRPTVARIVRFADRTIAPKNALEISHTVSSDLASHIRNVDRWNTGFTIIAGRANDETVEIQLDAATAQGLFAQPGAQFEDFKTCSTFWDKYIAPHLPDD